METQMTTKLHKAYSKNKKAYYYFKCDCSKEIITSQRMY